MRDLILTLFVFGMLPICFRRPYYGLLMWSWLSYMNPHRMTWSYAWEMQFVYWVALTTLLGLLFHPEERWNFTMRGPIRWWIFFFFWMTLTSFTSLQPNWGYGGGAWYEWERTSKVMLMGLVTLIVVNTRKKLYFLICVIAFSFGFFGLKGGYFTIRTGGHFYVLGPDMSFFTDNNTLAMALLISLPMLYYLYLQSQHWLLRMFLLISFILHMISILGTQSRGGILGLALFLLFFILKARRKFILILILGMIVSVVFYFMPSEWQNKMKTIEHYQAEGSAQQRFEAWQFGWNLAMARPILGGGFESFQKKNYLIYLPESVAWRDAHSIYFQVLAEHGFVGFAFFLFMHLSCYWTGTRINRMCRGEESLQWARDLSVQLQLAQVGFAACGAFVGMAYYDLPFQYIAIMVVLARLVENEKSKIENVSKVKVRSIYMPISRREEMVKSPADSPTGSEAKNEDISKSKERPPSLFDPYVRRRGYRPPR